MQTVKIAVPLYLAVGAFVGVYALKKEKKDDEKVILAKYNLFLENSGGFISSFEMLKENHPVLYEGIQKEIENSLKPSYKELATSVLLWPMEIVRALW